MLGGVWLNVRMDDKTALHTAARRRCISQGSAWREQYQRLERGGKWRIEDSRHSAGWNYSEEAFALFPRYRLDDDILTEVESIVPADCASLEELRHALGSAARRGFTKLEGEFCENAVAMSALRNELAAFLEYIAGVRAGELNRVEILPFRRVLASLESARLWELLSARWGIKKYSWFPLNGAAPPENALAFHQKLWDARDGNSILLASLARSGVERCFVLRELGPPDYELESSAVDPHYDGSEAFFTSDGEWLLYSSHESSITVAGWLADTFRQHWADADKVAYKGRFHTNDLRGTWEC